VSRAPCNSYETLESREPLPVVEGLLPHKNGTCATQCLFVLTSPEVGTCEAGWRGKLAGFSLGCEGLTFSAATTTGSLLQTTCNANIDEWDLTARAQSLCCAADGPLRRSEQPNAQKK